ncbi:MAG: transporter substrate-binding domain-containing protein [Gemmatimonadetes bacterium]|nr:transporter substrate-binding domain-containing protein [Gemmatimonadota bacterium]MBT5588416.1 transporter substrate-binding domain-containing protein [Gemmatimonadota bacterium]MBT5962637.1 transporter substrate-binding domain-containing protein [Gemmatimonadota bacterium]
MRQHPTIRVGADEAFPPVDFIDENGVHRGLAADYLALLNQRLGIDMQVVQGLTWAQMMDGVKTGTLDLILCIADTPERQTFFHFTEPYLNLPIVVFTRDDAPFLPSVQSLEGRRVAVVDGYAPHEFLRSEFPKLTLQPIPTPAEALLRLTSGQVDAFVGNLASATYIIQQRGLNNIKVAAPTPQAVDISMGVRKDWPELVGILNKGLRSVTQEERSEIYSRWLAVRYEVDSSRLWSILGWVVAGVTVLFVAVIIWGRQIRRREERFRAVLESTPDGMFIVGRDGIIILVNACLGRLFGYGSDEIIGQSVEILVPERFRDAHTPHRDGYFAIPDTWQMGEATNLDLYAQHRDGSEFPVEISLNPLQADGDQVIATVRDISTRKQREHHGQLMADFREAVWRLDSASEVRDLFVPLHAVLVDSGVPFNYCGVNIIESVEENRIRAFAFGEDDIRDSIMDESGANKVIAFWRSGEVTHRTDLQAHDPHQELASWISPIDKPRSIVDVPFSHGTLAANSLEPNAFTAYLDMLSDIAGVLSEGFRRLDDLRALRDRTVAAEVAQSEAEAANQAKSTFLANMSHEIRTPMNAILGFAEVLDHRINDPESKHYLHSILTSGRSLMALISDILDLSKIEAGKIEVREDEVELRPLFDELQATYSAHAVAKDLAFHLEVVSILPAMLVLDGGYLRKILIHLIDNAIKFTAQGNVKLEVSCREGTVGQRSVDLELSVTDTGVGIPADQLDSIFGAFNQQDGQSINEYGGTGLGLAISRHLVALMGGKLSVTSQVDVGSTFTVMLPGITVIATGDLPEDERDRHEADEGRPPSEDTWSAAQIDAATRDRLPSLLASLRGEIADAWEDVRSSGNITDIEALADALLAALADIQYPPLALWAEKLKMQASQFQMDLLPETLDQLPDLTEEIESLAIAEQADSPKDKS